jgi:predicted HD superfamily hydrolase involved in NAD metabolism
MKKLQALLKGRLKAGRYKHTLGVVQSAQKLAKKHGFSVERVSLAAWLHDCGKALDREAMRRLLKKSGADTVEKACPPLWHAPVGAWLARHEYGLKDGEALKAIRFHSTGSKNPGKLQKILFVADFTEPGRPWPELKSLHALSMKNLDQAYAEVLRLKILGLLHDRRPLHPRSLQAYQQAQVFLSRH